MKWVRDNLAFGLVLLLAISGVTLLFRRALDWYALVSAFWVFGTGFLLAAVVIYVRAPWKLYRDQQKDINALHDRIHELESYKRTTESNEVRLSVAGYERKIQSFGTLLDWPNERRRFVPVENAECAYIVFTNNRKSGIPGQTARSVLARVTYEDPNGRSFSQDGRWDDTDQPALLSPLESKNHLLRVDFEPGAEHRLDIAAKFTDGCYAVN